LLASKPLLDEYRTALRNKHKTRRKFKSKRSTFISFTKARLDRSHPNVQATKGSKRLAENNQWL